MKALRVFLALVGIAAIAVAIAYPFRDVKGSNGASCGSAWTQAKAELTKRNKSFGTSLNVYTSCKEPKQTVLKRSAALGGAGVLVLVVVGAWPERKWRSPGVVAEPR